MISPFPKSLGPKTELTLEKKYTAKELIIAIGYSQSQGNIFKQTSYQKFLFDLKVSSIKALLLYQTNEFKTYFFQYLKELDMLLSQNRVYNFSLQQLCLRVIGKEGNDFFSKCDIEDCCIFERLCIPSKRAQGNDLYNQGQDPTEQDNFKADHSITPTSRESNIDILRYSINSQLDCNKSIYVGIVLYEGESGKRTIGNKPASTKLLAVCLLISVAPRDFLGIFYSQVRYVEEKLLKAIKGLFLGLWLDHSEITGKLNQIRVAKSGEKTNVCLAQEWVNEAKEGKCSLYQRVLVIATREIMLFGQLIRPPQDADVLFGRSRELMLYKEVGVTLDYSNRKRGELKCFCLEILLYVQVVLNLNVEAKKPVDFSRYIQGEQVR